MRRNRIVLVPIVCRNDPDGCRGVVRIRSRGRAIGRKRYALGPGEKARVRVRIRRSAARVVGRRGAVKAIVIAKNRKRVRLTSARSRRSAN